jgi:hypothetical protein
MFFFRLLSLPFHFVKNLSSTYSVHVKVLDTTSDISIVAVSVSVDLQTTLHTQRAGTLMVCISVPNFSCVDPAIPWLLLIRTHR